MGRPGSNLALPAAVADLGSFRASSALLHSNFFGTIWAKDNTAADAKFFIRCLEELHRVFGVRERIHVNPQVDQMLQLINTNVRFSWLYGISFYLLDHPCNISFEFLFLEYVLVRAHELGFQTITGRFYDLIRFGLGAVRNNIIYI